MREEYKVDINRKVDFSGCKEGMHPFKVITRNSQCYDTEEVVRWCPKCGAVVVDMDFDNRTNPGYYKKIQYPEITLKYGLECSDKVMYLFEFRNFEPYTSSQVNNLKEAIIELLNVLGKNSDIIMKALNGIENDSDLIEFFNSFSNQKITKVSIVEDYYVV